MCVCVHLRLCMYPYFWYTLYVIFLKIKIILEHETTRCALFKVWIPQLLLHTSTVIIHYIDSPLFIMNS